MDHYYRLLSLYSLLYLVAIGRFALADDWETWRAALPNTQMPKSLFKILQPFGKAIDTKNPDSGLGKSVLKLNDNLNDITSAFPTAGKDSYSTGPNNGPNTPISLPHNITTFFLQNDLRSGKPMTLHFPKPPAPPAKFLPSTDPLAVGPTLASQLPHALSRFSVAPGSPEARAMTDTVQACHAPAVKGEAKLCAASLSELIGFAASRLGPDLEVFATEVVSDDGPRRRVVGAVREVGERSVVCHKENYAYAVFYCHEVTATKAYTVSLGEAGKAVAVCHTDTRYWSAELLVFKVLNVKPGTVPVCHFLPNDSLVWVPK